MIFSVILAGGKGSRMAGGEKPKQFLDLGGKPVILHSIDPFINKGTIETIIVVCPEEWKTHCQQLIENYYGENKNIVVISGGVLRNDSLMKAINYIDAHYDINRASVIVHDGARPFIDEEIVYKNITVAMDGRAGATVVPATDTIMIKKEESNSIHMPNRDYVYCCQTPQSFPAKDFRDFYNELSQEEKEELTDSVKLFSYKGFNIDLIPGNVNNIKITHQVDMKLAEIIYKNILTGSRY